MSPKVIVSTRKRRSSPGNIASQGQSYSVSAWRHTSGCPPSLISATLCYRFQRQVEHSLTLLCTTCSHALIDIITKQVLEKQIERKLFQFHCPAWHNRDAVCRSCSVQYNESIECLQTYDITVFVNVFFFTKNMLLWSKIR